MHWQSPGLQRKMMFLADLAATALSFVLAYFLRLALLTVYPFGEETEFHEYRLLLVIIVILWGTLFAAQGRYVALRYASLRAEYATLTRITLLGGFLLAITFFLLKLPFPPRSLFVLFLAVNLACLMVERTAIHYFLKFLRRRGHGRKSVLVVGAGEMACRFIETARLHTDWGLDVVGLVDADPACTEKEAFQNAPYLGKPGQMREILHQHPVDEVIIALPASALGEIRLVLGICEEEGVQSRVVSDLFGVTGAAIHADRVHNIHILTFSTVPYKEWQLLVKRIMDIVISATLLVLLAPLFAVTALAIKLTSSGPVFYEWKVVGLNKKPFTSWKFRTMVQDADKLKEKLLAANEMSGPAFKMKNDPRITPVGRILRKFSLDELPQLYSVLKGDMSLVGPRPPLQTEVFRFEGWQRRKLSIKPGITCLWQVNGRSEITDFNEWARLDLEYIDNWSLWLDLKILLKTIPVVIMGKGAY